MKRIADALERIHVVLARINQKLERLDAARSSET
jgi:hypothetical protein